MLFNVLTVVLEFCGNGRTMSYILISFNLCHNKWFVNGCYVSFFNLLLKIHVYFKKKTQLILLGKVLRAWLFSLSILSKLNSMTNNYIQIARIPTFCTTYGYKNCNGKSFKTNLLSVNNYIFSESIKEKSKNFLWKKEQTMLIACESECCVVVSFLFKHFGDYGSQYLAVI